MLRDRSADTPAACLAILLWVLHIQVPEYFCAAQGKGPLCLLHPSAFTNQSMGVIPFGVATRRGPFGAADLS